MVYINNMKGKEVVNALEKNGWQVTRIKGSHFIMRKGSEVMSVPCHNKDMGIGLLIWNQLKKPEKA